MNKFLDNKRIVIGTFILLGSIILFLAGAVIHELTNPRLMAVKSAMISPSPTPVLEKGLPVKNNSVMYTIHSNKIFIKYKDIIYAEDDALHNPVKVPMPDQKNQHWIAIAEGPQVKDDVAFDELFSFKTIPGTKNFLFTMRWDRMLAGKNGGQDIQTYYHEDTKPEPKTNLIVAYTALRDSSTNNFTKIGAISKDGKHVALEQYHCWGCPPELPLLVLYNLETHEKKELGKVTNFAWLEKGAYQYKDYKPIMCGEGSNDICSDDSESQPLKQGEF